MDLPPIGQPPEENCYDCFYAFKAALRIEVGLGLEPVVWLGLVFRIILWLVLVSGLCKWLFYLATARQLKHVVLKKNICLIYYYHHCRVL